MDLVDWLQIGLVVFVLIIISIEGWRPKSRVVRSLYRRRGPKPQHNETAERYSWRRTVYSLKWLLVLLVAAVLAVILIEYALAWGVPPSIIGAVGIPISMGVGMAAVSAFGFAAQAIWRKTVAPKKYYSADSEAWITQQGAAPDAEDPGGPRRG